MKVSIISPTSLLTEVENSFYLCYGEVVLRSQEYAAFFATKVHQGKIVILDFSALLPRSSVGLELLWKAYELIRPSSLVLPGVDFSWKNTLAASQSFIQSYGNKVKSRLIGLVEGYDQDTVRKCYLGISELCGVIGLPCSLEKVARREEIVRDLGITQPTIYLEILGNPLSETIPKSSLGICTSYPIRLAHDYRRLSEFIPAPSPLNFYAPKERFDLELVKSNIDEYLEAVNSG